MDPDDLELLGYGNQWSAVSLKVAKKRAAWLEENNESSLKRIEKRHQENPKEHLEAIERWRQKNKDKVRAHAERAKKKNLMRFGFLVGKKCVYCGQGTYARHEIASGRWHCKLCFKKEND